jgi:hypothetical protein
MTIETKNSKTPPGAIRLLRTYWQAAPFEAGLALASLLLIPSDPKNAWLLGLSKSRWVMAAALGALLVLFAGLAWRFKDEKKLAAQWRRLASLVSQHRWYLPLILFAWGAVPGWGYLYLRIVHDNLTTLQGFLIRLAPVLLLLLLRWLQTIGVLVIANRLVPAPPREKLAAVRINPGAVAFVLGSLAVLLVLVSVTIDVIEELTWLQKFYGFRVKLDLDQEANIPTFFSSSLLLILVFIFLFTGRVRQGQRFAGQWVVLGLLFLVLAVDEAAVLHEKLIKPLREALGTSGGFYFAWVVPAIPLVILFIAVYWPFFRDLPTRVRQLFTVGFALYLTGALGFEIIGGWYAEIFDQDNALYNVITTLEESIEIGGLVTLIYSALSYLEDQVGQIRMVFASRES